MKYFVILLSAAIFVGAAHADSNSDEDYRKFPLGDSYMYADSKHITDISLSWNDVLPHGTITFDKKMDSDINIMIPKNIPRMMNLDFGTYMAVFYPDTLVEQIKETETDCFYHLIISVNNVSEISIDTISVAAGRWEPVTIDEPKCDRIYKHYSETYELKSQDFPQISPLKQIKSGTALFDVKCSEEKYLVYKYNRMRAACVNDDTETELINRGWALMRLGFPGYTRADLSSSLCGNYDGKWHPEYEGCRGNITDLQCSLMGGEFVDNLKICYDGICPADKIYTLCVTNLDLVSGDIENEN